MGKLKAILAVLVIVFVGALIVYNASHPPQASVEPWNAAMAKGNRETGKHFIMYTDVFCPYCDKFSNSLHANAAEFAEKYLDSGKVFYEVRPTEINYLSGHSENSRPGGEAMYCAARQDKFWEYYKAFLDQLYKDFHSKGIGVDKITEKIPLLELNYFFAAGRKAGLDNEVFVNCMENHEALDELKRATEKTQRIIPTGLPYFVFGEFKTSGFDGNWDTDNDWRKAKLMLDAGL